MAVNLKIGNNIKLSTEIDYDDLVVLYNQYIKKYGEVPTTYTLNSKHNMPQLRIVNKILNNNNITYNDFINKFGKVKHVRTECTDKYDIYLEKYKKICTELGRALKTTELTNNNYGLPSSGWFVKYCPDKSVKKYTDFCKWCGFEDNSLKLDKEYVIKKLYELQSNLNRHIKRSDIKANNVGFSMIVINRIWGSLENCKKELDLIRTPSSVPNSFEYYKNNLDITLDNIYINTKRKYISWKDIENKKYNEKTSEHRTLKNAFKREGVDIFKYIKSKGFIMNSSDFSYHYTFDDGERVLSTYEYDFSLFLKENGYIYNLNYKRDIRYKDFIIGFNNKSKINCDYVINDNKYIEILGFINRKNWEYIIHNDKKVEDYKNKMILKKKLLEDNHLDYLFLFADDFVDGIYIERFDNFINNGGNGCQKEASA